MNGDEKTGDGSEVGDALPDPATNRVKGRCPSCGGKPYKFSRTRLDPSSGRPARINFQCEACRTTWHEETTWSDDSPGDLKD
jgi:DNA-directed RNA polymerase subunit M/transcription elongation factor TFIIS